MQAYKLKGTIDRSGQLIIIEPIEMPPGEVEVIVLSVSTVDSATVTAESQAGRCRYSVDRLVLV